MDKVQLERAGRNWFAQLIGMLFPIKKTTPEALHQAFVSGRIRKILFVRPHQGLGDLLLASPTFRAIKQASPSVEIHFLADTYNLVAVHGNRHLTRLWVWDKKAMQKPWKLISFLRELRAERFDVVIPLSSHVPSFTSYLLARVSGAPSVLAYETSPFYDGANWSRFLAHLEIKNLPETTPEWVKFMNLVSPMASSQDFAPEFFIGDEIHQWAKSEWQKHHVPLQKRKVGLLFGGNPDRPERLWPPAFWTELAQKVEADPRLALIAIVPPKDLLSGSRAREHGVFGEVQRKLQTTPPIFSHSKLICVAAFLQGLDLFVCVDGGLFHVAVASGIRTLGLFFVTDPARWAPPVPWTRVLRPPDDLPTSLPPDAAFREMLQLLQLEPLVPSV